VSKVAIIGSGFVGRAWAISFSRAGHDVALWEQDPQAPKRALTYIRGLLPDLEASDLLNGVAAQAVEARMRPAATLEAPLDGAAHVQENTPEDVEVKRKCSPS
jgi:3-hydroxyacyl-CoA dehydrogenase